MPIGATNASGQELGRTFSESFWTTTPRNQLEPAHATTKLHTPDALFASTPCHDHHQPRKPILAA
jgi:hypothetical protein